MIVHKYTNLLLLRIIGGALFILSVSSCSPVHRFTRVKKVPRAYSLNYCGEEEIKAPRTSLNKEPWIVYSDREKNESFNNPQGKVTAKNVGYLEPFLVIGKKGDFLKLIKYEPDVLKNGKLDYKKAEYYGWIPKSKLLLNRQSVTNISNGKKNKLLTLFTDTIPVNHPDKFFTPDSIRLYKDPELKAQTEAVSHHSIVYPLKQPADEPVTLIARKPYINPEEAQEDILGWVDNSLIKNIGTGLHVALPSVPQKESYFFIGEGEPVEITEDMADINGLLTTQHQSIRYNPVTSYAYKELSVAFKTNLVLPVFDYSDNYIFNVNGGQITHKEFRALARDLKQIHVSFVFEGQEYTIEQFPKIVNALQNLQSLFEQTEHSFSFQFNSVLAFDDAPATLQPLSTGFTSDYSALINFLSDKANSKNRLRPIPVSLPWEVLNTALNQLDTGSNATNLIILIGEKGVFGDGIPAALSRKLVDNNCRIIGFQVYAGEGNEYNNFVLDVETMISSYANEMLAGKCDILVSPEQIKRSNSYAEVSGMQNGYRLDFPENSITQGALFFPQKSEMLSMETLTGSIDTILQEIRHDHNRVIQYMSRAFRTVGNNRTRFDSLFMAHHGMAPDCVPQKKLLNTFIDETPGWHLPSRVILLPDSVNHTVDYYLMLSEKELAELKDFVASLSEKEVEYIYETNKKKKKKRKPCNCPEDDLFEEWEKENQGIWEKNTAGRKQHPDSVTTVGGAYVRTGDIRRHLRKTYLIPVRYCKLCKEKKQVWKERTLAEVHYMITGCPVSEELLHSIRIKELKSKKLLPDEKLDELITYYKKMKKELDKAEPFESNEETYYWVNRKLLP